MKKKFFGGIIGCLVSVTAHAATEPHATIINRFDSPLQYTVGINPQVLPDLPEVFDLKVNDQISTQVLDLGKQAYIRVTPTDGTKKSAFFGLEIKNQKIIYHGYIGKEIAYSWKEGTIIFCTPEEYKKNKHC